MGTCRGRLHRPSSTAPRQQHRAWKLRSVRRQLRSGIPVQDRRAGRNSRTALHTRLPPHVRDASASPPSTSARASSSKCVTASTTTTNRFCFDRRSEPPSATPAPNASPTVPTAWSATLNSSTGHWAFDVSAIERPVHMWQGTDDRLVPDPINKAVADRMPGSVWHPVEGAGHFVAVGAGDDIFAIAAEELGAP